MATYTSIPGRRASIGLAELSLAGVVCLCRTCPAKPGRVRPVSGLCPAYVSCSLYSTWSSCLGFVGHVRPSPDMSGLSRTRLPGSVRPAQVFTLARRTCPARPVRPARTCLGWAGHVRPAGNSVSIFQRPCYPSTYKREPSSSFDGGRPTLSLLHCLSSNFL